MRLDRDTAITALLWLAAFTGFLILAYFFVTDLLGAIL